MSGILKPATGGCQARSQAGSKGVRGELSDRLPLVASVLALLLATGVGAEERRVDWLSFLRGAVPGALSPAATRQGVDRAGALAVVDGLADSFTLANQVGEDAAIELVYNLPASTVFEAFGIVRAEASRESDFVGRIEIMGSLEGGDGPWEILAATDIKAVAVGNVYEFKAESAVEVQWLRVSVRPRKKASSGILEFTELMGWGTQARPALEPLFDVSWEVAGTQLKMKQKGATVSGCYGSVPLVGTVDGRVVRAIATDPVLDSSDLFVLISAGRDGGFGVRSSHGGPFRWIETVQDKESIWDCQPPEALSCDRPLPGIELSSDGRIADNWQEVMAGLYEWLAADERLQATIVAHASGEDSEEESAERSERIAHAVVADLIARGLSGDRLTAVGKGETTPVASNRQAYGRSLNQRIVVECRRETSW